MIAVAMLLSVMSPSAVPVRLDCNIWPTDPMSEVTSQTPFAPAESVAWLNGAGNVRISFEKVGNELRDVDVRTLSDPMGLDQRKSIKWQGAVLEGGRVHLKFAGQARNSFRWITLDPDLGNKFSARWSFSEPVGSGVIFVGSGFGECAPQASGVTK